MDRSEKRIFEMFNEKVESELPSNSQKVAFHKVNDEFEKKLGFKPYGSWGSYRNARSRNRKFR